MSGPGVGQPAQPGGSARGASIPASSEFTTVADVADIRFDFDKYEIRPGDAVILRANAAWLRQNTGDLVLIEGHCDERGTNEYNIALGERRAKATMDFLVAQGWPSGASRSSAMARNARGARLTTRCAGPRTAARTSWSSGGRRA